MTRVLATNRQLATNRVLATSRVLAANRSLVATVIPSPPLLTNAIAGDTQVELYWNFVSNAITYNVYRALISGGPYSSIATGLTGGYLLDSGLTNGTTYFYEVTGVNGAGESGVSNELSATPAAASNPSALVSGAGSTDANGEYTPTGTHNGKPFFNLSGTSPGLSAISWTGTAWQILSAGAGILYSSTENVASPWLVVTWTVDEDGTGPAPVVASSATNAVVSGGTLAGTYTYRGFWTNGGENNKPFYNLLGQPTDFTASAIFADTNGDGNWVITDAAQSITYASSDVTAFPWLAAWTGITVTQG